MRLIDTDELFCKFLKAKNLMTAQTDYAQGARDIIEDMIDAPTVDAVPREELLNILNGRLDFLKKWKDETTDFKKIAEAKIEDCEEIIDIIKSYE